MNDNQIIHVTDYPAVLTANPHSPAQNPAYVYLASLGARSGRSSQGHTLKVIARWLGGTLDSVEWSALRYPHTMAIKAMVQEHGYSPASQRKFLCALRGVMKAAWRLGQISLEESEKATEWGRITGKSLPIGRFVSREEMAKVFKVCTAEKNVIGTRDAAIIALLYGCGLRREEVTRLDLTDYHREEGTMLVHGKRGKERIAYITNGTKEAIEDWLALRGPEEGPLILAVSHSGTVRQGQRVAPQMVYNTLSKRVNEAGVEPFSPHSLRRSFASQLLDFGVDISTVSRMMGHTNIQTTSMYDRRPGKAQEAGALLLEIPYKKE